MAMTTTIPVRDKSYRPPPSPVKIHTGVSSPAVDNAPFFLTTLPAEVRNEIYGWLFKRADPIVFTGRDRVSEPDFVPDFSGDDDDDDEGAPQYTDEERIILCKPSHDIGPGIALLRTSRQIYHEAIGLLYGANDFLISSSLITHNNYMHQLKIAETFVRGLGGQLPLLKQITIDISPFCHADCEYESDAQGRIDILPLLRLKWFYSTVGIRLKHNGRRLDARVHMEWEQNTDVIDIQMLGDVAEVIGTRDRLGLRRFARFDRLLINVLVSRELEDAYVTYASTNHPRYPWRKREVVVSYSMRYTHKGRLRHLQKLRWTHNSDFHPLSEDVYRRILRHAMRSSGEVILDLDHSHADRLPINLFSVNQNMRRMVRREYGSLNRIVLRMTTFEAIGTFLDWQRLRSWRNSSLFEVFPRDAEPAIKEPVSVIELNFDLASAATLADVRIGIVKFLRLTYHLQPHCELHFNLLRMDQEDAKGEAYITTLESIRKAFFVFISSVMTEVPKCADFDCPEVWIDGRGNIIEAVYPNGQKNVKLHWPNVPSDNNPVLVGCEYIKTLRSEPPQQHSIFGIDDPFYFGRMHNDALTNSDSLNAIWESLRDLDWHDIHA